MSNPVLKSNEPYVDYRSPRLGYQWTFDGVDDYGLGPALNISGEMTICLRVKFNGTYDSTYALVANNQSGGGNTNYMLEFGRTDGQFSFSNNGSVIDAYSGSTNIINNDEWHHIAVVRTGSTGNWTITFYIDGEVQDITTGITQNPLSGGLLAIGRFGEYVASGYLKGSVDDVRIYSSAKTADQILAINNYDWDDLDTTSISAGYWCKEESGTDGFDWSANGNNLTLSGITHTLDHEIYWNPVNSFGYTNNANVIVPRIEDGSEEDAEGNPIEFNGQCAYPMKVYCPCITLDGVNDYINTDSTVNLSGTNKVSVSFWMYKTSFSGDHMIVENSPDVNGSNVGFFIFHSGTTMYISLRGDVGYNSSEFTTPSINEWHFYTATFDKSQTVNETALYIDGILQTAISTGFTGNNTNNFGTEKFWIGSRQGSQYFSAHRMCEFRVYSDILTSDEVTWLYTSETSGTDPTLTNLVLYYPMQSYAVDLVLDVTGNGNHAKIYNATTTIGTGAWANRINGYVQSYEIRYGGDKGGSGEFIPALLDGSLCANGGAITFGPGSMKTLGPIIIIDPYGAPEYKWRTIPSTFQFGDTLEGIQPFGSATLDSTNGYSRIKIDRKKIVTSAHSLLSGDLTGYFLLSGDQQISGYDSLLIESNRVGPAPEPAP